MLKIKDKIVKCEECGKQLTMNNVAHLKKKKQSNEIEISLCKKCYKKRHPEKYIKRKTNYGLIK